MEGKRDISLRTAVIIGYEYLTWVEQFDKEWIVSLRKTYACSTDSPAARNFCCADKRPAQQQRLVRCTYLLRCCFEIELLALSLLLKLSNAYCLSSLCPQILNDFLPRQGVKWLVMTDITMLSMEQLNTFRSAVGEYTMVSCVGTLWMGKREVTTRVPLRP